MAKARRSAKKRRVSRPKQNGYLVFYKVSIFTALVIVLGAFLLTLFAPFVSNSVAVLGTFTSR